VIGLLTTPSSPGISGIYELFLQAFQALPLAAIVVNEQGNYFCVHGGSIISANFFLLFLTSLFIGLSPSIASVGDIDAVNRFQEVPDSGPLCDLIWSDPLDDSEIDSSNEGN